MNPKAFVITVEAGKESVICSVISAFSFVKKIIVKSAELLIITDSEQSDEDIYIKKLLSNMLYVRSVDAMASA